MQQAKIGQTPNYHNNAEGIVVVVSALQAGESWQELSIGMPFFVVDSNAKCVCHRTLELFRRHNLCHSLILQYLRG